MGRNQWTDFVKAHAGTGLTMKQLGQMYRDQGLKAPPRAYVSKASSPACRDAALALRSCRKGGSKASRGFKKFLGAVLPFPI